MNTPFPKLLRRTAFVLGLMGAMLQAEDSFAQKKRKKVQTPPHQLLLQPALHQQDLPMDPSPTKKSSQPRQRPRLDYLKCTR